MQSSIAPLRSYRCHYCPLSKLGIPIQAESGVLPFVQLRAANAEAAHRAAHHVTGCPVANVERQIEEVAA